MCFRFPHRLPLHLTLTLWCNELLFPACILTMVCKLAGVLVDFVIGLPDELSGSDTRALSERTG
jgi:hypothetical protein